MPFSTQCTNKSCRKIQAPYMDKETEKVYCSECHQEILGLTYFAKVQMKSIGQYRERPKISFATKCNECGLESRPKNVNNDIVCGICGKPLKHLSDIFKNMLKEQLKTVNKDV